MAKIQIGDDRHPSQNSLRKNPESHVKFDSKKHQSKSKALSKAKEEKESFHKKYAKYDAPETKDRWSMGGNPNHPFHK